MERHFTGTVASNSQIARDTFLMAIQLPREVALAVRPGQFIHIAVPSSDARILRRPISVNYVDRAAGTVHIAYAVVGGGTELLSRCGAGTKLDIVGPLGKGFVLRPEHKTVWLVGGGIGCAPLLTLAEDRQRAYTAFLGFKSEEYAYETDAFERFCKKVLVSTDDGSMGAHCFVTDLVKRRLEAEKPSVILACGPTPMLRALKQVWQEAGGDMEVQVSLEQRMGCGTGGCYTCTCAVGGSMKRVCTDGPVFDISEVAL